MQTSPFSFSRRPTRRLTSLSRDNPQARYHQIQNRSKEIPSTALRTSAKSLLPVWIW
jgi:hypothetical protein